MKVAAFVAGAVALFGKDCSALMLKKEAPGVNFIATSTLEDAGRGVFAGRDYKKGEVVEADPSLTVHGKVPHDLVDHTFDGDVDGQEDVVFGLGSFMNSDADKINVEYGANTAGVTTFVATRDISRGEELFQDYGYGEDDDEGEDGAMKMMMKKGMKAMKAMKSMKKMKAMKKLLIQDDGYGEDDDEGEDGAMKMMMKKAGRSMKAMKSMKKMKAMKKLLIQDDGYGEDDDEGEDGAMKMMVLLLTENKTNDNKRYLN